jgi:thiosulfate/3-mercaptopyruvate sulfurtransferase
MKKTLILALLLCYYATDAQEQPVLVTAQWVHEHLKDPNLVILQSSNFRLDFEKEHIEGAHFLWPEYLAPNSPEGSFNAPEVARATDILRMLGVNNESHIVLCPIKGEVTPTARMFLTLEHFGLRGKVSFLNGGLESWKKEGYPIATGPSNSKKGNVTLKSAGLLVDKDYVIKTLKSEKAYVVDARAKNYYGGEPTGNPRDGHIAGAKNIYFMDLLDASNNYSFKTPDELKAVFTPVASSDKELVTYCFIGQTASVVYMSGRILGYDMKLYDGSMQEWSRIDALPMEKSSNP